MIEDKLKIQADFPLLPYKILHAGDLNCIYEAGNIRYIKCGNVELIRMIYTAVRDRHWGTIVPEISNEIITENETSFDISYTARYKSGDIHFEASIAISGKKDNKLSFSFEGSALSDFEKNRIGICILHPIPECAGKEVIITQPDEKIYKGIFPELISPHQPFKNIQKMQWQPAEGIAAEVMMSGDTFETEDQRNWSDNSYKTYSTPLELGYPIAIMKGATVQQQVLLSVKSDRFPKIGIRKNHDQSINIFPRQVHHHRVELYLFQPGWQSKFTGSVNEAEKDKVKLELIVFFDNQYEILNEFNAQIASATEYIYSILLLNKNAKVTPPELLQIGYASIKSKFPSLKVGYGTDRHFTELNRSRPENLPHDFVSFSLQPQAHSTDTRTIIENLESLPDIIKTIRSFTNKAIHISPVTLNERNVNGNNYTDSREAETDSRLHTHFGKRWFELFVENMAGVDCITL